jgi:predicted PurR-regulated permease PerM
MDANAVRLPFYARLALSLLAIVLILFIMSVGKSIFIPLVFALLVSVLLYPLCSFMEQKWKLPRWLASIVSLLTFIAFIVGLVYFFTSQVVRFAHDLPKMKDRFDHILVDLQFWIQTHYGIDVHEQVAYINDSSGKIVETIANSVGNTFLGIATFVIWMIFVFIFTYFMLFHRRLLYRFATSLFKARYTGKVVEVVTETQGMINNYVVGLITEMVILAVLNTVVLGIMGIPYFLLIGVLAAVINIIPYLGIYTAMAIGMLITFAQASGTLAIQLAIAFIIIHFIDANVLLPRIVGKRVKMNPLITIITVLAGHLIWGIPGMFLFIPMVAIFKIISHRIKTLEPWCILIGTEDNEEGLVDKLEKANSKEKPL